MKSLPSFFLLTLLFCACGQKQPIYSTKAGAIKGYDPVAYFMESKPVKGKKDYSCEWMGAIWYFASKENRDMFESSPFDYAPQFGGYCAYGVAMGDLVKVEPEAWKIVDNKLYLNYDLEYQKEWEANQDEFIAQAEAKWPELKAGN